MDKGSMYYESFLQGEKDGLVMIIKEYKDGLILYINGMVHNILLAEELAEETFVRIGTKKPRDNKKASFKTWLYTIGRNITIDHLRKHKKKTEREISIEELGEMKSEEEGLCESYIKNEEKLALHKVMEGLKEEYRTALWLTYFEGLTNKETAKIMKKSVHGTETLIYRARLKLKEELEKGGFSYEGL